MNAFVNINRWFRRFIFFLFLFYYETEYETGATYTEARRDERRLGNGRSKYKHLRPQYNLQLY